MSCTWVDQGWGNRKGRLAVALLRCAIEGIGRGRNNSSDGGGVAESSHGGGTPAARDHDVAERHHVLSSMAVVAGSEVDLFGIAEHEARTVTLHLDESHEGFRSRILDQQRPGDGVVVLYAVGGGGGHSLTIKDFRFVAAHSKEANRSLASLSRTIMPPQ